MNLANEEGLCFEMKFTLFLRKTFPFGAEEILIENEQADSNTKNKFRNE